MSRLPFVLAAALAPAFAAAQETGLHSGVRFTDYPAAAEASQIVRRMATPLTGRAMRRELAISGKALDEHALDPSRESFTLYVPARAPPGGYGVLVYVPPVPDAAPPGGWTSVLERAGFIYVAAAGSGNEAYVIGRRVPLALIAEAAVASRYRIDARRVFIGGFSGGSHVALRLALGYPDIFAGALLNAGADTIGDERAPLPPADLFARFQASSRLAYVTGEKDQGRRDRDADSLSSVHHWCVANVTVDVIPRAGHQPADAAALARALAALQRPPAADSARLAACRAGRRRELDAEIAAVRALIDAGKTTSARGRLLRLDARFGGLAAPQSLELAAKLGPP